MMKNLGKLVLAVGMLIVGVTVVPASASATSAAASCYDNKKEFTKPTGQGIVPAGQGYWKTTSNCADINLYLNTNGRYVKALAFTTNIDPKPSCHDSAYSWVPSKSWTVVQSNVPNGRYFFFCFKPINTGVNTGASGYAAY